MEHSQKGSDHVKNLLKASLLKNSPFYSHLLCRDTFSTWVNKEALRFPNYITEDMVGNNEFICSKYSKFKNYENKHVLIVGGGPSTSMLDFSKQERDFTWSVNHFYLNPVLNKLKVDMAMIMGEPDITSKEFIEYRDKFKPMIGFEIHDRWNGYKFDNYENYFLMHTDFYSKLGACVRMIILACFLKAKKVSFVGLDGPDYIKKGQHAFEKNKTTLPSEFSDKVYEWHYFLFWDYIKKSFKGIEFKNLGYGQKFHKI